MPSALGELLRAERVRQGLTPQALAQRMGYTNVDGCANRIRSLERDAARVGRFACKVIGALGRPESEFDAAPAATERESPPARPHTKAPGPPVLVLRFAPAVYWQVPAAGVSSVDLMDWAVGMVRQCRAEGVLLDPPRPRVWLDATGVVRSIEELPSVEAALGYWEARLRSSFQTGSGDTL